MIASDTLERGEGAGSSLANYLPQILWQKRYYILAPFLLLLLCGIAAAFLMPTTYRSSATLLVETQDLPKDLVQSPTSGAIDQRVARIREEALSRGNLISIIEQNDLYLAERRSKPLSKVIEKMRHATVVGALAGDIGQQSGSQSNTIAISMTYDYSDPAKAQSVLQNLVSKFVTMDTQNVEDQAVLSVRFLQDQATKLQMQISSIERNLTILKTTNGAALASSGASPMIDTGSFTAQIAALQSDNRQLIAQSRRPGEGNAALAAAEGALAAALAQYSDSHPDVAQARQRLEVIRRSSPSRVDESASTQQQIAANNQAIQSLMAQRDAMLARASNAMAGQARAPAVMEQASQLENRAATLRAQYQQISENLLKAQNSARMATEQRADRLTLVEPASLPDRPISPNRPLIIAAAALAGLGLGVLFVLGLEFARKPVRSPRQLEQLGFPVLGVVPLIQRGQRPRRTFSLPWQGQRHAA